jgi:hypothetical protein
MLSAFLDSLLGSWVVAHAESLASDSQELSKCLEELISSILLNPEILRNHLGLWTAQDQKIPSLLSRIFKHDPHYPKLNSSAIVVLPGLLHLLVSSVVKHRSVIFVQTVGNAERISPRVRARRSLLDFMHLCFQQCDQYSGDDASEAMRGVWKCKLNLLSIMQSENLLQGEGNGAQGLLRAQCKLAVTTFSQSKNGLSYCSSLSARD